VIVDIVDLGIIPRLLFATDGRISHILEAYAGETVDLVGLTSSLLTEALDRREFGAEGRERVLQRVGLLRGRASGRVFVHAESVVMLDRVSAPVADELTRTSTSVLKLFSQHRIATFREGVGEWEGHDEHIAAHFGIGPGDLLVARTYQVVVCGRPVAWITESFPKNGFS